MVGLHWGTGKVTCPRCDSENVWWLPNAKVFKCYEKHEKQKFSLKVGTIFEDSPIALEKWLPAMRMLVNCKNGISSYEIHRAVGVTQKTGWFMLQRGRLAKCRMNPTVANGAVVARKLRLMKLSSVARRATCTRPASCGAPEGKGGGS